MTPGLQDVTTWGWVRAKYGSSMLTAYEERGAIQRTTLKLWRPRELQSESVITISVREEEVNTQPGIDLTEIDEVTEKLRTCSDDGLESYWRARNALDRDSRIRIRTMIWDECERRFAGFTRRPIEVRLPFFHEVLSLIHI